MDTRIELPLQKAGDGVTGTWAQDPEPPERSLGPPVVVTLSGPLSETTAHALVERLSALLHRHRAVVADISGIELAHSGAVHAFTEAVARAGEWPDVRLAVAAPDLTTAALLVSSRVAERVPVHPDVATALAHVDDRPDLVRGWWHFDVDARAPGDARQHVRRVCGSWAVDEEAREAAEIVVTELVTNAVEHAESASVVEVERRAHLLRLTVRDFDLAPLPEAHLPAPTSPRGRGLAMVAAVATAWGVETHRDGKTVWAEMATV
ncbi:anti-sigma regulatory factor (Ser/Thr protein kinase) [Actinomycetospora succinea]|uniref:Anti-sigma regulatory factor (Ser/Thr protein kinase) n=1 Tax=Actinomycetospora succinea TaxID=663603 RepID=A0A4R6USS2_9PSEU|nr:ATP-binding protein [Actinomycetospora succinea]TDQ46434.1 anti-sigma regulatory factor (Ser/Thr protein kinase) [Actinomycetospora succinea]